MKHFLLKLFFNTSTLFIAILVLFGSNILSASELSNREQCFKKVEFEVQIDHSQWDKLLKKYVDNEGYVDYPGFQKDSTALNAYLEMLSKNQPQKEWNEPELLAYYINLYNAVTVKLIVENYPVKSIRDISRAWTKNIASVGNKKISLDDIEHNILRKMNEPKIHFALNCASISCPKLSNEAYTASRINAQLESATKDFINSDKNDIGTSNSQISAIFKWYIKDFKVSTPTELINFINQYSKIHMNPDAKVMFKKYNWNLNERN